MYASVPLLFTHESGRKELYAKLVPQIFSRCENYSANLLHFFKLMELQTDFFLEAVDMEMNASLLLDIQKRPLSCGKGHINYQVNKYLEVE